MLYNYDFYKPSAGVLANMLLLRFRDFEAIREIAC